MKIKKSLLFDFIFFFAFSSGKSLGSLFVSHLRIFASTLLLLATNKIHGTEPQIVIHWTSETVSGHPDILKDINGDALSAGGAGNGDGCLVTLGYFDK